MLAGLHCIFTTQNQNQITWLSTKGLLHLLKHLLGIEFIYTRLDIAVGLNAGIDHTFSTYLWTLDKIGQLVELLTGIVGCSFSTDTANVSCRIKHTEAMALHDVHQFHELHAEAQVWFVTTIIFHCLSPWHTQERLSELHTTNRLEEVFGHAFKEVDDIILFYKRHFTVNLREFRLAICTQVFVTETLGYLEIAVESAHHQELLQGLRTLRKCIELSRIHTRRNHEITCTFWGRSHQDGCFHLNKALFIEVFTDLNSHLVAQFKVLAHCTATQVEITILHPNVISTVRIVLDGKGRSQCSIEHVQFADNNLNFTRRQIRILTETFIDRSFNLNDKFSSQAIGLFTQRGIYLFIEDQLSQAIAVAQVYEGHASHLTATLHPSGQRHLLVYIREP